tara:strand:+ start:16853 stop:17965 length:1113 start_codon:yes stop_codon:yes gene_type:complete
MKSRIHYTKPSITDLEVRLSTDAAANGWGTKCYAYIDQFERLFKKYLGVEHTIATSSCTGAMHMGLSALGIGPGDEVILADTNWIATVSPIVHLGATPVFVDILSDSWCLDPEKVEASITTSTKAIIATHLYGNLCDMEKLQKLAIKYNLSLIEDAAEAIGSEYMSKKAGSIGIFGVFSFHGTKTVTTGEGGMFVTNNIDLFKKVMSLSNHGRKQGQKKQFWPDEIGFKFKISNVQAAIGCGQMHRINELVKRKRDILRFYKEELLQFECLKLNFEPIDCINGAWMPTVLFSEESGIKRELLQKYFHKNNIDARVFFWPLSSLPMFKSIPGNTNSYSIPNRAINLPSYHDMIESDLIRVVQCIKDIINES